MRRSVIAVASVLILCFGALGWMKVVPRVRRIVEVRREDRQAVLRESAAESEWRREFGDPNRALAEFPAHDDNQAALRLVDLARSVGISLARPEGRPRPWVESPAERDLNRAVAEYVDAELTRTGGEVGPPPATVREFFAARGRELDEIVRFLATSERPSWRVDVSLGPEAPVPNVLPQLRLQRLLVAEALNRAHLGRDIQGTERVFDASWALNASLRDRPDVISQLVAISIARLQVGLARRVPVDPERWRARLSDHDYRASLLRAMEVESIAALRDLPAGSSPSERTSRADFLDVKRTFLAALRDSPVSDGPLEIPARKADVKSRSLSAGGVMGMLAPTLAGSVRRADRLIVDTELTVKVLEARMLRARLGRWPAEIPNIEASRVTGERWTYRVDRDGRMAIFFSRELRWESHAGMMLPLRHVAG